MKAAGDDKRMRCISLPGIIYILIFALCGTFVWAEGPRGPKMVLKERTFDFEQVNEGETLTHIFQVMNAGDQSLEIVNVKPG
jgi:hypothetical protein